MAEDTQGKGFVIRDRRTSSKTEQEIAEESKKKEQAEQAREEKQQVPEAEEEPQDAPFVDFSAFILSLSSSAMMHFGEIPDPLSQQRKKNLAAARQVIDIISMLQEKTRGNLEEHEQKLVENVLYELRLRYVRETEQQA